MLEPDDALQKLDSDIKRLKVDFDRFFNGGSATPPEQLRKRIQNQIQDLRSIHLKTVALRFRFNTLEARFNTLSVLFNRRLRLYERGLLFSGAAEDLAASFDASRGIAIGDQPAAEAVRSLYLGLYPDSAGPTDGDFERFRSYVLKQASRIRRKTGCAEVQFRVASEQGQVKLKAKPLPQA